VAECADLHCPFHPYRHGIALDKGRHAPLRACKTYCSQNCLPDSVTEGIWDCGGDKSLLGPCPVFPFRLGTNPNVSQETRATRRAKALERVAKGTAGFLKTAHHRPIEASNSTENHPS
jgi:hypothetical protein